VKDRNVKENEKMSALSLFSFFILIIRFVYNEVTRDDERNAMIAQRSMILRVSIQWFHDYSKKLQRFSIVSFVSEPVCIHLKRSSIPVKWLALHFRHVAALTFEAASPFGI